VFGRRWTMGGASRPTSLPRRRLLHAAAAAGMKMLHSTQPRPARYSLSQNRSGSPVHHDDSHTPPGSVLSSVESQDSSGAVPSKDAQLEVLARELACRIWPLTMRFPARALRIAHIASMGCRCRCTAMKAINSWRKRPC
jgi:hypothetical protein